MKVNDAVIITAKENDLSYIHKFNRLQILEDPKAVVYHVYKDGCDVRTVSGIWYISKKYLEVV